MLTILQSLPLVFPVNYGFSPQSTGLVFLSAVPAIAFAVGLHFVYIKTVQPRMRHGSLAELESHLILGMVFSWLIPAGLFLYGKYISWTMALSKTDSYFLVAWSARPSIHWVAPTFGLGILMFAMYFVTQSIFAYIPLIYPRYAASILAASSFARSVIAFAAILIAEPLFTALGVDGGVSLLAGLTVLCALGMALLWQYGKWLRQHSRFAID